MGKWKKRLIFIGIFIAVILLFRLCTNPKIRIFNLVKEHETEFRKAAEQYLSGEKISYVGSSETIRGAEVHGVAEGKDGRNPVVEFFYAGRGIVPASTYYGFYYSPADEPVSHQNGGETLLADGKDRWKWTGYGDNGGITVKIMDCWYYYEAWY